MARVESSAGEAGVGRGGLSVRRREIWLVRLSDRRVYDGDG